MCRMLLLVLKKVLSMSRKIFKMVLPKVIFRDDKKLIPYATAWDEQFVLLNEVIQRKKTIRTTQDDINTPASRTELIEKQKSYLWFCEHPPVFTLGKSGSMDNLLYNEDELAQRNATFFKIIICIGFIRSLIKRVPSSASPSFF